MKKRATNVKSGPKAQGATQATNPVSAAPEAKRKFPSEAALDALFDELNNAGRWGRNDELGTLNYITPQKRIAAASLVRTGRALSLARDLDTLQSPNNPSPVRHTMCYQAHYPIGSVDALTLDMHGFALTHLDAIAHVYRGAKNSQPHDHGPSWAVYCQVAGVTEMTDWRLLEKPAGGQPGKVEKVRSYMLTPGTAHLYNEGDLHSPRRENETRLIRIEGTDLTKVKRDKFEIAA